MASDDSKKVYLKNGKFSSDKETPDYKFISTSDFFSPTTNLIPQLSGVSGNRVLLGDKASLQAISLVDRQTPLVQSKDKLNNIPFVKKYAKDMSAIFATNDGEVTEVNKHKIVVGKKEYELYDNYLTGQKSFLDHVPAVKVGDKIKKGDLLATSNFTDKEGNLALGTNLTTAVMPFRSNNFEDAYVISETGAKKLVGEQMIPIRMEKQRGLDFNKDKFISLFPNVYLNEQISKIDSDGVVKKGSIVSNGDPLILAFEPRSLKTTDAQLGNISSILKNAFSDKSESWGYESPGEVVDVAKTDKLVTLTIKTRRPMSQGDKLSCGYGAKGVTVIRPDNQMPTTKDGNPVDIVLNSMSIVSRIAPSLMTSLALGKIAQKTGKPIVVDSFDQKSLLDLAQKELKTHNLSEQEDVYDPTSGKHIHITVGPLFFNRLCLTPDHDVLTKSGWKKIEEIDENDEVATLNPQTNCLEYLKGVPVTYHYEGKLYNVKSKFVSTTLTLDHKMYVAQKINSTQFGKYELVEARNLIGKIYKLKIGCNWKGTTPEFFTIKGEAIKIRKNDGIKQYYQEDLKLKTTTFLAILGQYLSEGSNTWQEKYNQYVVNIWQYKQPNLNMLIDFAKNSGLHYFLLREKADIVRGIGFSGKTLTSYFKQFGNCYNKYIPNEIFDYASEDLEILFQWLMWGDGHAYSKFKGFEYKTTSKRLAEDVQRLCLLTGRRAKIEYVKNLGNYGKNPGTYYIYRIYISEKSETIINKNAPRVINEKLIDYKGYVHCISLPKNHIFYVKKDGMAHWTGNCHISEDKVGSRGQGISYTADFQPSKSNEENAAKKVGNLATNTYLTHNARHLLEDVATIRSTRNDEYWRKLKLGEDLPPLEVPFIFKKFISHLEGAGIKVNQKGSKFNVLPQTNKDIEKVSKASVENPSIFKIKAGELIPEKGGLFDPDKTGIVGENYNHINLENEILNPITEEYIKKVLGLTSSKFDALVQEGKLTDEVRKINVDKKISELEAHLKSKRKTDRNNALKALLFLKNLKHSNITPSDLILNKIPVIPSIYRPLVFQNGKVISSGINELYRDVMLINHKVDDLPSWMHPEDIRMKQYNAVKAVYGLGAPVSVKNEQKGFKGLLASALGLQGGSAKESMFQSKVVNKPIDLVSRAVLVPDSNLDLDYISVPQSAVWKMYTPFIIKRLVESGLPATYAKEYVDNKHPLALEQLSAELKERPGLMSRDPQLNPKYSHMGYYIKMNTEPKDTTLKVNPMVFKQLGADCDGDQLNISVPVSLNAVNEIKEKMLPSRNLILPRNLSSPAFIPPNESALGLYLATTEDKKNKPKEFNSVADMKKAFNDGEVGLGDRVTIKGSK